MDRNPVHMLSSGGSREIGTVSVWMVSFALFQRRSWPATTIAGWVMSACTTSSGCNTTAYN
ncbi:hypothetical protein F441_03109 [Phytophthora nicotianae CJ01A1]|uniref:Uncharacterized protein n=1 Tax=Phytophthora nicotianae CJ01A1 TaxID=1317063 RepID=W2XN50_PHYNI|nr:hypothetical protein F441_03109 [Phytophthora nicotianae CJ01A1]